MERRRWGLYGLPLLLLLIGSSLAQTTFSYTGAAQTYTVPPGVALLTISACGAQPSAGAPAGKGGFIKAWISVTEGTTLYVYVGGTGGYNGGGGKGYMGGGGTDIRSASGGSDGSTNTNTRLVVAGGGGANSCGGAGGGLTGQGGTNSDGGRNGAGGTQTSGGLGGSYECRTSDSSPGTLWKGGNCKESYGWGGGGGY